MMSFVAPAEGLFMQGLVIYSVDFVLRSLPCLQ